MSEITYDTFISDLEDYDQNNPAPKSFTVGSGKLWRHYELGEIFGLVAYGDGHVMITELQEDDDNWFCFSDSGRQQYDSAWVKTKIELYIKMQKWLDENLTRGYYDGFEGREGFECGYRTFKDK